MSENIRNRLSFFCYIRTMKRNICHCHIQLNKIPRIKKTKKRTPQCHKGLSYVQCVSLSAKITSTSHVLSEDETQKALAMVLSNLVKIPSIWGFHILILIRILLPIVFPIRLIIIGFPVCVR